jgi:hypothetical protein
MAATEKDIAHWTARVAELEQQLDAATKLSKINMIDVHPEGIEGRQG